MWGAQDFSGTLNSLTAKTSDIADSHSGLSLGVGSGRSQGLALYETTNGHYHYGVSLAELGSNATGICFFGGTGLNTARNHTSLSGVLPAMLLNLAGNLGLGTGLAGPTQKLEVIGNALISGSLTASSKSFLIDHPDPEKAAVGYKLRHWSVETADCPGGLVQYRRTVDMTSTTQSFQMQDWFSHLVKEVTVHVCPYQHFGSGWGECQGNTVTLHATTLGKWHVLVVAARADDCAENHCEQEVEYLPPPAQTPDQAFPP